MRGARPSSGAGMTRRAQTDSVADLIAAAEYMTRMAEVFGYSDKRTKHAFTKVRRAVKAHRRGRALLPLIVRWTWKRRMGRAFTRMQLREGSA
jgi:hypothetical protein